MPDHGHRQADRRPDLGASSSRRSTPTAPSSASAATRWATPTRASCTSSAPSRAHPAGHDDRLRRQPHLDARRLRRARLRHRHHRGRARARHPDAAAARARRRWPSRSTASSPAGVTAKDIMLAIIGRLGTGGGIGHVIEYRGSAIRGALDGGPHDASATCRSRPALAPGSSRPTTSPSPTSRVATARPDGRRLRRAPSTTGESLATDDDATFDTVVTLDAATIRPHVTWGTNPGQVVADRRDRPRPRRAIADPGEREAAERALAYMGLDAGTPIARHRRRHGLHRLVHQLPDRRPARRGEVARRPQGARRAARPRRARIAPR